MIIRKWQATVWGPPRARKSHRQYRNPHTGRVHSTDPSAKDKSDLRSQIVAQGKRPKVLITGPKTLAVSVYKQRPKSLANRILQVLTKPDADNYAKLVCDAFNGFIWPDDKEVVLLLVSKHFCGPEGPHTDFLVFQLSESVALPSSIEVGKLIVGSLINPDEDQVQLILL